jgi:hypothetical protein
MPRISIIGVRTGHLVNARPATQMCISFDLEGPIARSRPSPSWVDCITSIGVLHDGLYFCALQPALIRSCKNERPSAAPICATSRVGTGRSSPARSEPCSVDRNRVRPHRAQGFRREAASVAGAGRGRGGEPVGGPPSGHDAAGRASSPKPATAKRYRARARVERMDGSGRLTLRRRAISTQHTGARTSCVGRYLKLDLTFDIRPNYPVTRQRGGFANVQRHADIPGSNEAGGCSL